MAEKRIMSVDKDTAEVLDYTLVAVPKKLHNGFAGGWIAMSQGNAMLNLAMAGKDIGVDGYRVLFALLARLNFENAIHIVQREVADELGMQQSHVSRAIKKLLELEILAEGPRFGRNRTYKLNPNYGWKGSAKNHHKALRAADKAKAAGLTVHEGGKDDAALRAKMEADGQGRLID